MLRRTGDAYILVMSSCVQRFSSQVVEDGYEFFAKRQLVTLFSAPNYCGEFDNAGAMMSVDETLMCSFQVGDAFLRGPVVLPKAFLCPKAHQS